MYKTRLTERNRT